MNVTGRKFRIVDKRCGMAVVDVGAFQEVVIVIGLSSRLDAMAIVAIIKASSMAVSDALGGWVREF